MSFAISTGICVSFAMFLSVAATDCFDAIVFNLRLTKFVHPKTPFNCTLNGAEYEFKRSVGSGMYGIVFLAADDRAVKFMSNGDESFESQRIAEEDITKRLYHISNHQTVQFIDYVPNPLYDRRLRHRQTIGAMVLKMYSGGDAYQYSYRIGKGKFSESEKREILVGFLSQMCSTFRAIWAHSEGHVVLREVRSDNMLVEFGAPARDAPTKVFWRLADFGAALEGTKVRELLGSDRGILNYIYCGSARSPTDIELFKLLAEKEQLKKLQNATADVQSKIDTLTGRISHNLQAEDIADLMKAFGEIYLQVTNNWQGTAPAARDPLDLLISKLSEYEVDLKTHPKHPKLTAAYKELTDAYSTTKIDKNANDVQRLILDYYYFAAQRASWSVSDEDYMTDTDEQLKWDVLSRRVASLSEQTELKQLVPNGALRAISTQA